MSNEKKTKVSFALILAVLAIYMVPNTSFIANPALSPLANQVYTSTPYNTVMLLSTITSLCMIPSSIFIGAILGKKIKYKTTAIICSALVAGAGVGPFFSGSFTFAMIMRILTGLGIGMVFPLQNTLIAKTIPEEKRAAVLGAGSATMSACGVIYMLVSGFVCDIDAKYSWLIHAAVVVPLVIDILLLKEPEDDRETQTAAVSEKLPGRAVFCSIIFTLFFTTFYPILLNMTAMIEAEGLGTAATAGTISSIFTVGGVVAGFVFAGLYRITGKFAVPAGCLFAIVGMGLFAFVSSIPAMTIGVFLVGMAVQTVWPGTMNNYGKFVPISKMGLASSLFTSGMCLGCFLSSFFVNLIQGITGTTDFRTTIQYSFFALTAVAVIWMIVEIARPADKLAS